MIVGRDLVEFDRRDVPLYQEPPSLWGDAGVDPVFYGAPLDRLFGEPGDTHVVGQPGQQEVVLVPVESMLVELGTLADALVLPDVPPAFLDTALGAGSIHDSVSWDGLGTDWTFDL